MIAKATVDGKTVVLRKMTGADIPRLLSHLYSNDTRFLEALGYDPAGLGDRGRDLRELIKASNAPDGEMLLVERDSVPVGHVLLEGICPGKDARIKGLPWSKEASRIVEAMQRMAVRYAFNRYGLQRLSAELNARRYYITRTETARPAIQPS